MTVRPQWCFPVAGVVAIYVARWLGYSMAGSMIGLVIGAVLVFVIDDLGLLPDSTR